ncbi:hypothetical protein GCM10022247_38170 [Allokutzneria multivorans]|uniref:Uncharacterized protein n=1 Tax=Allokutzneria multivorans TaxID=1142134 RepID=A0ABP7SHX4_9PSEU
MSEPTQRPRRPTALIAALVILPVASLLFAMAATHLGGPRNPDTSPPVIALVFSLLAIRFGWARATSLAFLAFLTILWLPGAVEHGNDSASTQQAAIYVFVATALFIAGAVLAYQPVSSEYYKLRAQPK